MPLRLWAAGKIMAVRFGGVLFIPVSEVERLKKSNFKSGRDLQPIEAKK